MNHKSLVSGILIISLLSLVFISYQKNSEYEAPFNCGHIILRFSNDSNSLNLTSRAIIYEYISDNPGVHLRNICRSLGISMGSTQYHISQLVENGLIECFDDSKYKRFFLIRKFSDFEKKLLSHLRRPTVYRILKILSKDICCSHMELASTIGVSSQAITWQMKRLIDDQIITSTIKEYSTYYTTTEKTQRIFHNIESYI